jgi:hypothetical protein
MRDSLLRGHRVRSINLQFDYLSGCNRSDEDARRGSGIFLGIPHAARFFAAVVKCTSLRLVKRFAHASVFHIIQLTDRKQARRMIFDEARAEIGLTLENEKRQTALQNLAADLLSRAEFVRSRL